MRRKLIASKSESLPRLCEIIACIRETQNRCGLKTKSFVCIMRERLRKRCGMGYERKRERDGAREYVRVIIMFTEA